MNEIQNLYLQFLGNFPEGIRPVVSIVLAAFIIYSIFKVIKKDWIFIVVLIVLLPSSVPILKSVWQGVVGFVKFMLGIG